MRVSRDPFQWWYSVREIARRVEKHPKTIRRAIATGQFGARPGEPGFAGRWICGELLLPWSAVALFLKVAPEDEAATGVAWRARSEGELRRQVAASKRVDGVPGPEVAHG